MCVELDRLATDPLFASPPPPPPAGELLKVLGSAHPKFEAAHYNLRAAELPSPCIIIKTTYSKAAVLQLPAG